MAQLHKGRSSGFNPPNRFEQHHFEPLEIDSIFPSEEVSPQTRFLRDASKSALSKNDSPDIPFNYSLNPYRGCEHGCIYCYARPSHEYLGFSAGLDFETNILVKDDVPILLAKELQRKSWIPQMVCISGNTDCYQPIERKLQLTRGCLEVFLQHRNPVGIITKNFLITRDVDMLSELALMNLVLVTISITTLDPELAASMEPRTSSPGKRLEAIELLSRAGIPTVVNVAPIIPGLTDEEIPSILAEATARGAKFARYIMLRLPGAVEPLFLDWLKRELPARAGKIINRIRDVRSGKLSESNFGKRMKGEGELAGTIQQLFKMQCDKLGLNAKPIEFNTSQFRREPKGQMEMF